MANGPLTETTLPADPETAQDRRNPASPSARFLARLSPESKRLLLSACLAYFLCLWQALCVYPPWPQLGAPQRPDLLDLAGPALNPAVARKLTWDLFGSALAPGEVRAPIDRQSVRRPIDPDGVSPDDPDSWARLAEAALWSKSEAVFKPTPTYTMASLVPAAKPGAKPTHMAPPGMLAARFESGDDGAASVGHTPRAGTSYGTFQIASGTPTYSNFMRYLKERAPDLHGRLAGRGPANTGSTDGSVPQEWRRIAGEQTKRFERLQYEFILATHYRPAVAEIFAQTGVDVSALSPASREVLWSAAVQHGPGGATDIFTAAIRAVLPRIVEERHMVVFEKALIEEVYKERLRCYGHGPYLAKGAMLSRYDREKSQALGLLDRHYSGT
jgi:hypothetical protein